MPEHRIRLRGAWDQFDPVAPDQSRRVDLPVVWADADSSRSIRLVRRFGRPRFDPALETIELEVADAPGITSIRLNGATIGTGGSAILRIAISERLEARNTLELDVDPAGVVRGLPWGTIALVIVESKGSGTFLANRQKST